MAKMGRPFGALDSRPRKKSIAQTAQRQCAWAKAMEIKSKKGQIRTKIDDGFKHLSVIRQNVDCSTCEVRNACPHKAIVIGGSLDKCPLYPIYRNAIIDVTQNPLMYLSKTAARLEVAIMKQQMLDRQSGTPFSKELASATKLALEAAKIAQSSPGKATKRIIGRNVDDEIFIEAEAFSRIDNPSSEEHKKEGSEKKEDTDDTA